MEIHQTLCNVFLALYNKKDVLENGSRLQLHLENLLNVEDSAIFHFSCNHSRHVIPWTNLLKKHVSAFFLKKMMT